MDRDFFEKLIAYYKCKVEDDERYGKRIENEERDAYRVMKALRDSKHQIIIKNIGDLARLLNVAKQLTATEGRNIFEDFYSIPQVETIINNMISIKPEQIQAIQDYDFSDWEPNETPLEQEHRQIEDFRRYNTDEIYFGTISKIKGFLVAGKPVQIKSEARTEVELTEKDKAILAMSKMLMRRNGLVPNSELQFKDGIVSITCREADKVFGDTSREHGLVIVPTPVQIEEDEKQEEHRKQQEKLKREQQQTEYKKIMLDRWAKTPEQKEETEQQKKKYEQTMQERWGVQKKSPQSRISKPTEQHSQNRGNGISR